MSNKKKKAWRCCCGHKLINHDLYNKEGRNHRGSRFVCTVDGCSSWGICDIPDNMIPVWEKMKGFQSE